MVKDTEEQPIFFPQRRAGRQTVLNLPFLASFISDYTVPDNPIVAVSPSGSQAVYKGEVFLWPVHPTIAGYKQVISQPGLWQAYGTLYYTVFGAAEHDCHNHRGLSTVARAFARRFFFMLAFSMHFPWHILPVMITTLACIIHAGSCCLACVGLQCHDHRSLLPPSQRNHGKCGDRRRKRFTHSI